MTSATRGLQAARDTRLGPGLGLGLAAIVASLSTRYDVVTGPRQVVRRARLDTFDRRLHAAGLTLEHRRMASCEMLVVGRPGRVSPVAVPVTGLQWPARAEVLPAGPVRDEIASAAGIRALMVASDERRCVRSLDLKNEDGKTVARVDVDEPASTAAGAAVLTVRALRGYDDQARLASRLLAGLGLQAVEHREDPGPRSELPTAGADREVPASVLLTMALTRFLATMQDNLPGLLDDVDTEFLHDFRVAVRRTRATLKLGRPALPEVMRSRWEPAFKGLGDTTTPVRDLDVYELGLPTMRGWLVSADPADLEPLAAHLHRRRTAERRTLTRRLRSVGFERLVTGWGEELAGLVDPPGADQEHPSAGRLADRSISRAYRRVARDGALIVADSPAGDLHGLRKRCKELRYALEVFAPLVDAGASKRAVADLKGLQDVLGRFQDSEVQRQALRGFAEEMMSAGTPAGGVLAMGELIGHLDAEQDRARREFDVAFARFARPSSLQLMHRLGGRR